MAATEAEDTTAMSSPADRGAEPLSIVIRDLHVRYKVFEERRLSASELVRRGFRTRSSSEVHALRGIDLEIGVGESVGIVGPNGSGKSTLLRCIAGVQPIESGEVLVRGRAQLLAVNAALDPTLSGGRNIVLGGLAMGMTPEEVAERFDGVVEFSGLADAINRPMRTYSSGMRARLSFSIATMYEPPILLIDEALAVGDRQFRRKSLARIREIRSHANTVVMVTHHMVEIRKTCNRVVWIEEGLVVADGPTEEILAAYEDFSDGEDV